MLDSGDKNDAILLATADSTFSCPSHGFVIAVSHSTSSKISLETSPAAPAYRGVPCGAKSCIRNSIRISVQDERSGSDKKQFILFIGLRIGGRARGARYAARAGVGASLALGNGVRPSPARGEGRRPGRPSPAYGEGRRAHGEGVVQGGFDVWGGRA